MPHIRRIPKSVSAVALTFVALTITVVSTTATAYAAPNAKVTAIFAMPRSYRSHPAVTYDPRSVPLGSRVAVLEQPNNLGGLVVKLKVWGLSPNTKYDAYVYTRPCGATPASPGKRTQDGPSTLHYAQNEVWLNFTTNVHGAAQSSDDQYWQFSASVANSVVVLSPTAQRLVACVTVPFK